MLDLHGWGDLQTKLNNMSKLGEWAEMAKLIDDEVLETFAVVAPVDEVAPRVRERFGDVVDRFSFYAPYQLEKERWRTVLAGLRA